MTKKEFLSVVLNVIKAYPVKSCGGLNSFVIMDDIDDIIGETFGKDRSNYELGEWWSRKWVEKGKPDACSLEFPLFAVNQEESRIKDLCKGNRSDIFYFWVIDKIDCEACQCNRTYQEQYSEIQDTLIEVVNEIMTYGIYSDADGNKVWANQQIADANNLDELCEDEMKSLINSVEFKIGPWNQNSRNGMIAVIGSIEVSYCTIEDGPEFNYASQDPKELPYTICETC